MEQAGFARTGGASHDHKPELLRQHGHVFNHGPSKRFVAAFYQPHFEANLAQNQPQRATAFATTPTIEQWLPVFWQLHDFACKVAGNVGSYQGSADFVGFESAFLFVNRAHPDAFFIGEGRPVHSPRQMVQGVFRFAAGIDDATEGTSGARGHGHALHGLGGRHRVQGHQSIFFNTAHTLAKIRGWASALG